MAAPAGRVWRKRLHLHVRIEASTLWHLLDAALQVKHPRTVAHRSTVRTQLRLMNGLRSDSAAWAVVCRWFRRAAGSVEARLAQLSVDDLEIYHVLYKNQPHLGGLYLTPGTISVLLQPGQQQHGGHKGYLVKLSTGRGNT